MSEKYNWQKWAGQMRQKPTQELWDRLTARVNSMAEGPVKSTVAGIVWWDYLSEMGVPDGWSGYLDDILSPDRCKAQEVAEALVSCGYPWEFAKYRCALMPNDWGMYREF